MGLICQSHLFEWTVAFVKEPVSDHTKKIKKDLTYKHEEENDKGIESLNHFFFWPCQCQFYECTICGTCTWWLHIYKDKELKSNQELMRTIQKLTTQAS